MLSQDERKTVAEMFGELLREAAVLIIVFGFLDKLLKIEPISAGWAIKTIGAAASSFLSGVTLERVR